MDLLDPNVVDSLGRKRYTLIVRDDVSRYTWVYFMRHKSDAAEMFEEFLVDTRADGFPSKAVIVRSDGGLVNSAGGGLAACVDHEVSIRNSARPIVPDSMG